MRIADLPRVVLAVPVDLDREVEAVLPGVLVSRLHRAADADVERQPYDLDPERLGPRRGSVP